MDDSRRIIEADDLVSHIDSTLEELEGNALPPEEILQDFLLRLKGRVFSSLLHSDLIAAGDPFPESFVELFDLVNGRASVEEGRPYRALGALAVGGCLEEAMEEGRFSEAVLWAMQLGAKLTHRAPTHSFSRIGWTDFEPLSGQWPEVEDMSPSSPAGRLASVIQQGREIWGQQCSMEEWKVAQARRLKDCRSDVFQQVERYGNDWKSSDHATEENPMYLLCSQIDPKLVLRFARQRYGAFPVPLDERISDAQIYALYAILWAYRGLSELWDLECGLRHIGREEGKWVDHYLAEAEGFIRVALKFHGVQSASEAVNEANRKRGKEAYESKYGKAIRHAQECAEEQWEKERELGLPITTIGKMADSVRDNLAQDLSALGLDDAPAKDTVKRWIESGVEVPKEARKGGRQKKQKK